MPFDLQLLGIYYFVSLDFLRWFFVVADFAWKKKN